MEENDEDKINNEGDDESSTSSGEDSVMTVEPEYDKANSIRFSLICNRMEKLWALKRQRKRKITDLEKKQYLLPQKILKHLEPQSVFPLFRLLMPDIDNSRNTRMKEKSIAQVYCDAKGFAKGTKNYKMLYGFTDPQKVPHEMAGDLSLVVQHVLSQRMPNQPSRITLGQVNTLLDDLATIAMGRRNSYNHEWRNKDRNKITPLQSPTKKRKKATSSSSLREQWLRKVMAKGLSPLEHKWLVRILLQKMEFGLGWRAIMNWYNPYAIELWNSHNSLKNLCDKLADPSYTQSRREEQARKEAMEKQAGILSRWEPQDQPAGLGNTISPMLSSRVFFADCMTKLEWNHREYEKKANVADCLAMKFPTFCAEIKFDGERMVVHVDFRSSKNGQVTMQTRNGKWYSPLYSPVLGPAIRKSLSKYRVSVILDGEVESWDNGRQELVPFGNNRTVANARRGYMQRHGLLEEVDRNLHAGPDGSINDPSVMRTSDDIGIVKKDTLFDHDRKENRKDRLNNEPGKDCWLKFFVFDIIYVDGPDVKTLFKDCLMNDEAMVPGSILHLTLLQRKIILYQLLQEQPNEVEIGKSVVVRSNGDSVSAESYFSVQEPLLDGSHSAAILDSTQTLIQNCMPQNLYDLDRQRRHGRDDIEISRLRSKAIDSFYSVVVEQHKMEGLVLKDLASPYILGQASRSRKYWHKFKPDYEEGEGIDVVILGGYFATGLRHSGRLSHFLCGVVDESDPTAFMTVMSVNGKSIAYEKLDKLMDLTGYKAATADEPLEMGKWFEPDDRRSSVPDFISHRSYQRDFEEDFDGWIPSKKMYPDLWIHPEDSVVLELKGQEFVRTKEFSAGLTMRFPRIKYVRHEAFDGGTKSPYDADSHRSLYQLYYEAMRQRQESAATVNDSTFSPSTHQSQIFQRRFLTPAEYARKPKSKRRRVISPSRLPKVEKITTEILKGISFTILEGNYSLDPESLEAQAAKDNGWLNEAIAVRRKEDVMKFVLLHGGSVRVSTEGSQSLVVGGRRSDARVINFLKAVEYARSHLKSDKISTKKASQMEEMANREGVLRWTFVYSIVYRWLAHQRSHNSVEGDTPTIAITETIEEWLQKPKPHEYLVRSGAIHGSNDHIYDLQKMEDITKVDLLCSFESLPRDDAEKKTTRPWQYEESVSFPIQDRSALDLRNLNLFLDKNEIEQGSGIMMLYPDIFREGFGIDTAVDALEQILSGERSNRWQDLIRDPNDQILSVLPLASAMGAMITPHLHEGVSHVLCNLKSGSSFHDKNAICRRDFLDEDRGAKLLSHLNRFSDTLKPVFVDSRWVRSHWNARSFVTREA